MKQFTDRQMVKIRQRVVKQPEIIATLIADNQVVFRDRHTGARHRYRHLESLLLLP